MIIKGPPEVTIENVPISRESLEELFPSKTYEEILEYLKNENFILVIEGSEYNYQNKVRELFEIDRLEKDKKDFVIMEEVESKWITKKTEDS